MAEVKIDVAKLNAAFQKALPDHEAKVAEQAAKADARRGFSMSDIGSIEDTFCSAWVKIQGPLNLLLTIGAWFLSSAQITMIRGIITAINEQIVPAVCGTKS